MSIFVDEESESIQYKPLLDFRRFRNFLEAEQEQAEREDQVNKAKDAQALAKRLEAEMAQLGLVTPDTGNFFLFYCFFLFLLRSEAFTIPQILQLRSIAL